MEQIDFKALREKHPQLRRAFNRLEDWFADHPGERFLIARKLALEIVGVPLYDLALALQRMRESGLLAPVEKEEFFGYFIPDGHGSGEYIPR